MHVNLSIKSVPEALAARLRARALRNHRSLQGELMAIIASAATEPDDVVGDPRPSSAVARRGSKTIEQIAAEHRLRFPRPISAGPMAVDILRADRDRR